ncbi:MAG TPA: UUP1 family membrane protein [Deltaproteobacteria bacterium]|jgi:hypothetical protein|nr:UUP1 family membrane protein [Deltaproteobacteria bacterium]HPV30645.1 UUP1 family membrane protein [Deltaproteobacteria bacterium]HQM21313.1 UUP1 family membrane protein [Deltaproteobacteria bacterium]
MTGIYTKFLTPSFSILESSGNRHGEWSIRNASGPQTLYYKAQVLPGENADISVPAGIHLFPQRFFRHLSSRSP